MAAVGAAVGLGNMWRFPYLIAANGGAAFLLLYVLLTVVVALPVLVAELALGRGARKGPVQAFVAFGRSRWRALGVFFAVTGFVVLSYYGVVAGWTLRYAASGLIGGFGSDAAARFRQISVGWDAVAWQVGFMAVVVAIVTAGIRSGIERAALLLMPLLVVILVGLDLYVPFLDGSGPGYRFFLHTDFGQILSLPVVADATGQAFFSLSLGMGAMLTLSSYLAEEHDLGGHALVIAGSDFVIALLAGLLVFPLIFALGLSSEVGANPIGALFVSLPGAFAWMEVGGNVVGSLFFGALLVGALTSAVSMLEVVVSSVTESLGWARRPTVIALGAAIAAAGIPSALDTDLMGLLDPILGNVFLLVGGLGTALFVGWLYPAPEKELEKGAAWAGWHPVWKLLLRWLVPVVLVVLLAFTVRDTVRLVVSHGR